MSIGFVVSIVSEKDMRKEERLDSGFRRNDGRVKNISVEVQLHPDSDGRRKIATLFPFDRVEDGLQEVAVVPFIRDLPGDAVPDHHQVQARDNDNLLTVMSPG